jgi:hypothetical protein
MDLIKVESGLWKFDVKNSNGSDKITLQISCHDYNHKPCESLGHDALITLLDIKNDAFELREFYLNKIIEWRTEHIENFDSDDELSTLAEHGINIAKLLVRDYLTIQKWKNSFHLSKIDIDFLLNKDHNRTDLLGMTGFVVDPLNWQWQSVLGFDENPKYETGEGLIEHG